MYHRYDPRDMFCKRTPTPTLSRLWRVMSLEGSFTDPPLAAHPWSNTHVAWPWKNVFYRCRIINVFSHRPPSICVVRIYIVSTVFYLVTADVFPGAGVIVLLHDDTEKGSALCFGLH